MAANKLLVPITAWTLAACAGTTVPDPATSAAGALEPGDPAREPSSGGGCARAATEKTAEVGARLQRA